MSDSCFSELCCESQRNTPISTILTLSSPAALTSIATNLLHERTDTESQRLWVEIALQLVELFVRKTDVR